MEESKHFRDLPCMLYAEDHIVLKLESPWPRDSSLPEGCSLSDKDSRLLLTSQKSLVASRKELRETRISGALFAGCESFNSSDLFDAAAREVLKDTEEICIVHNRDTVYKLIRMFPNAKLLNLHHDLVTHALELDEPCSDRLAPLVESSQLRQLLGCVDGQSDGCLLLSIQTVHAVLLTCPLICRIDCVNFLAGFILLAQLATSTKGPAVKHFAHMRLLTTADRYRPGLDVTPNAADVALAARTFTHVVHLVVAVQSTEAIATISGFRHLLSLSLKLSPRIRFADVDSEIQRILKSWPRLEKLSLELCGGLRMSAIARLCPRLKSLSLVDCQGAADDVEFEADAFRNLEAVEFNVTLPQFSYYGLLIVTSDRLRRVRMLGDRCSSGFLHLCRHGGERVSFKRLEELTLVTALTVRELGLEPEDLHSAIKALPALRRLETDSYDMRLFFENYCVPRGRVSLDWCQCVYCGAHGENVRKC